MKLTLNGIKEHEAWKKRGFSSSYDVEKIYAKAKEAPVWVHFGIGNIFGVFVGRMQTDFSEDEIEDEELPVWRPLTMM